MPLFGSSESIAQDFLLVEFPLNILSLTEWILPEIISHYISRMCCVYIIKPWNPLINVASISQTTIGLSHKTTCSPTLSLSLCYPQQRQMRIFPFTTATVHCYESRIDVFWAWAWACVSVCVHVHMCVFIQIYCVT